MKPDKKGNKEVTISLAKAVAKENNQVSINNVAQKARRKLQVLIAKGKGKDIPLALNVTHKPISGVKQGRKRKHQAVVDTGNIIDNASTSKPVLGPRKLRKRGQMACIAVCAGATACLYCKLEFTIQLLNYI